MKILIDNGHGIETAGKRSPVWSDGSHLFEYEFNRDVAKRLHEKLTNSGIDSVLLVPELKDISLAERVRRVNQYCNSGYCFLISIHANAGGGTGWEIFTSRGETKSDEFATILFETAQELLPQFPMRKEYSDGDPDKEESFYVLTETLCPAVLTENLFMDNENDCRFLISDKGRETIAEIHYQGIKKILGL